MVLYHRHNSISAIFYLFRIDFLHGILKCVFVCGRAGREGGFVRPKEKNSLMPVHQLSRRACNQPISTIYASRPANWWGLKYDLCQKYNLRRDDEHDVSLGKCPWCRLRTEANQISSLTIRWTASDGLIGPSCARRKTWCTRIFNRTNFILEEYGSVLIPPLVWQKHGSSLATMSQTAQTAPCFEPIVAWSKAKQKHVC